MKTIILTVLLFISSIVYGQKKDTLVIEDITFDLISRYDSVKEVIHTDHIKTHVRVLKYPDNEIVLSINDKKYRRLKNIDMGISRDFNRYYVYTCIVDNKVIKIYSSYTLRGMFTRLGIASSEKLTIFALDSEKRSL
jgi:hypothetical protein